MSSTPGWGASISSTGAAVLICPGGGYSILAWDLEGEEVAAWLNSIGVTGVASQPVELLVGQTIDQDVFLDRSLFKRIERHLFLARRDEREQ